MTAGVAPSALISSALAALRDVPVTVWPFSIRWGMSARPAAPVAPAMRMCMDAWTRRRGTL